MIRKCKRIQVQLFVQLFRTFARTAVMNNVHPFTRHSVRSTLSWIATIVLGFHSQDWPWRIRIFPGNFPDARFYSRPGGRSNYPKSSIPVSRGYRETIFEPEYFPSRGKFVPTATKCSKLFKEQGHLPCSIWKMHRARWRVEELDWQL